MDPLKSSTLESHELAVDPVTTDVSVEARITPDLNYLNPLKGYLGVETLDPKTSTQLDYIYQQLKTDPNMSDGDVLAATKEIKFRVGYPRLGETMTSKVYNYLRAAEQVKEAEKRRDALLS